MKKSYRVNFERVDKIAAIIHKDLSEAKFSFSVIELLYACYILTSRMEKAIQMRSLQTKVPK